MFLLKVSKVFAIFLMAHLWLVAMMVMVGVLTSRYLALPSSWSRPWWDTLMVFIASPSLHQAPTLLLVEVIGR